MVLFLAIFLMALGIGIIETDPLLGAGFVIIGLFVLGAVGIPVRKGRR